MTKGVRNEKRHRIPIGYCILHQIYERYLNSKINNLNDVNNFNYIQPIIHNTVLNKIDIADPKI